MPRAATGPEPAYALTSNRSPGALRADPAPEGRGRARPSAGLRVIGAILAVLAVATLWALLQSPGGSSLAAAPALPTRALVPPVVSTGALRGRVAVVHFWASWCEPCKQEARSFAQLGAVTRGHVPVVAVDSGDELGPARSFVSHYGWQMPVLLDGGSAAERAWGVTGLPTTFILDTRGRIARKLLGPQSPGAVLAAIAEVRAGTVPTSVVLREASEL